MIKARRNLPQNLKQPLKVSKFVQLYLLKRQNIFKFHFLDMLNNEFTVQIGPQIDCSCIPGYYDHCIHSFYVLQKIFKLKDDNPLLWKNTYTAKDLQNLMESEKDPNFKNKEILRNLKSIDNEFDLELNMSLVKIQGKDQLLDKDPLKNQIKVTKVDESQIFSQFKTGPKPQQKKLYNELLTEAKLELQKQEKQLFGQDEPRCCPICHENITYETPTYQCKEKCKNYFHIKCLKFWVKHQRKTIVQNDRVDEESFEHRSNIRVSCPMCRTKFPEKIDQNLTEAETKFKKYYQSQNFKCSECTQEIYLKMYHCLLCKNVNICDTCYKGWKHQKHDRFLMKVHKKSEWEVPPGRSAFNMSKLQFSLEYIKKLSKNSEQTKTEGQIKQLFGENYSKFIESNLPKPQILEYLKESFVNVQKEIHKTYKQVDFNEESLKCLACKKPSIIGMKRMFCTGRHFFDEKCLTFFLKNNLFQCPLDKTYFLQGLEGIDLNLKENAKKINKNDKLIKVQITQSKLGETTVNLKFSDEFLRLTKYEDKQIQNKIKKKNRGRIMK